MKLLCCQTAVPIPDPSHDRSGGASSAMCDLFSVAQGYFLELDDDGILWVQGRFRRIATSAAWYEAMPALGPLVGDEPTVRVKLPQKGKK